MSAIFTYIFYLYSSINTEYFGKSRSADSYFYFRKNLKKYWPWNVLKNKTYRCFPSLPYWKIDLSFAEKNSERKGCFRTLCSLKACSFHASTPAQPWHLLPPQEQAKCWFETPGPKINRERALWGNGSAPLPCVSVSTMNTVTEAALHSQSPFKKGKKNLTKRVHERLRLCVNSPACLHAYRVTAW